MTSNSSTDGVSQLSKPIEMNSADLSSADHSAEDLRLTSYGVTPPRATVSPDRASTSSKGPHSKLITKGLKVLEVLILTAVVLLLLGLYVIPPTVFFIHPSRSFPPVSKNSIS